MAKIREEMMRKLTAVTSFVALCWTAWAFPGSPVADAAEPLRYRYVSLNDTLPQEFIDSFGGFTPFKVTSRREVYGSSFACTDPVNFTGCYFAVLLWRNGSIRVVTRSALYPHWANDHGIIGGGLFDFNTGAEQAALLVGGRLKVLDRLPGEISSYVSKITNTGIALIESFSEAGDATPYLYWLGRTISLKLRPALRPLSNGIPPIFDANELGVVAGTGAPADQPIDRAFRFVPPRGPLTVLEPAALDTISAGEEVNNRGDVLGYSIPTGGGPRGTRIGVWRNSSFQTYYVLGDVPGNPGFPEYSLRLLWNEPGLIVNVAVSFYGARTFLLSRPGVRIDLNSIVDGAPGPVRHITDLNDTGDLVGFVSDANFVSQGFLLRRLDRDDMQQGGVAASTAAREAVPARQVTRAPYATERKLRERLAAALRAREAAAGPPAPSP